MFSHLKYSLNVYLLSFSMWMIVSDKRRNKWRCRVEDIQLCLFSAMDRTNRSSVRYKPTKKRMVEGENDNNREQGREKFPFDTLIVMFKEIERQKRRPLFFFFLLLGFISTTSTNISILKKSCLTAVNKQIRRDLPMLTKIDCHM